MRFELTLLLYSHFGETFIFVFGILSAILSSFHCGVGLPLTIMSHYFLFEKSSKRKHYSYWTKFPHNPINIILPATCKVIFGYISLQLVKIASSLWSFCYCFKQMSLSKFSHVTHVRSATLILRILSMFLVGMMG